MSDWKFLEPPNMAVITDKRILSGEEWIAFVSHDDEDGAWQFHILNGSRTLSETDGAVVSLREIIELDRSVEQLADLPLGWHARRGEPDAPWKRSKTI